jgi:DNA gyrase subunit B
LLTLFFRHFPDLIAGGHLYIAQPPLYQLKKGADIRYAYSDKEKEDIIKDMGGIPVEIMAPSFAEATEGKEDATDETQEEVDDKKEADDKTKAPKIGIQRYKGLGEMNPEQLWSTTMNPDSRVMKQVNVEDAAKANEVFEMLMGDEVAPRKHFIQTHAKAVKNLDI